MRYYYRIRTGKTYPIGEFFTIRSVRETFELLPATPELDRRWAALLDSFDSDGGSADDDDGLNPVFDVCKTEYGRHTSSHFVECANDDSAYAYILVAENVALAICDYSLAKRYIDKDTEWWKK